MKKLIMIVALFATIAAQAQQITSSGLGIAGNAITGTSPRYNINLVTGSAPDGSRNPQLYISISDDVHPTKLWPIFAPSPYSSAYCQVWDISKGTPYQYGFIKATATNPPDGKAELLGGCVIVNLKKLTAISFQATPFYTPPVMPTVIKSDIYVYQRNFNNNTGRFVLNPNLTIRTPLVSGIIMVDETGTQLLSGSFTGLSVVDMSPVPPPGGPGVGAFKTNPLTPAFEE